MAADLFDEGSRLQQASNEDIFFRPLGILHDPTR